MAKLLILCNRFLAQSRALMTLMGRIAPMGRRAGRGLVAVVAVVSHGLASDSHSPTADHDSSM